MPVAPAALSTKRERRERGSLREEPLLSKARDAMARDPRNLHLERYDRKASGQRLPIVHGAEPPRTPLLARRDPDIAAIGGARAALESPREGTAAPALALQDAGKTLIVAIPQATVQLDPAVAGSNESAWSQNRRAVTVVPE